MIAPVMRLADVRRPDEFTFEGTLVFDDEPMCKVRGYDGIDRERSREMEFHALPGQSHEALHVAVERVLAVLPRVSEWMRVENGTIEPASIGRVVGQLARHAERGSLYPAMGDVLLDADLSDLPAASHYVLADDGGFGGDPDWNYPLTLVVPCESEQAAEAIALRMRRAAVSPPWGWDNPRFANVRSVEGPLTPVEGVPFSLVPTGAGGWLWHDWPEIPPPDRAIELRAAFAENRDVLVGEFDVPDGKLVIKDPTYDDDFPEPERCMVDVVPGRYRVVAEVATVTYEPDGVSAGARVLGLTIRNIDEACAQTPFNTEDTCAVVPVDGGCVGIFAQATRKFAFGKDDPLRFYGLDARGEYRGIDGYKAEFAGAMPESEAHGAATWRAMQATFDEHVGMVGGTGCVSSAGMGDGQYYAMCARRPDGGIVGVAIPFISEGFSLTRAVEQPQIGITPSPYYETALGRADSYLASIQERDKYRAAPRVQDGLTVVTVQRLVDALRKADAGDRSGLDAVSETELRYIANQVLPRALESPDAYVRRGGEILQELTAQTSALRVKTVPSVRFTL